jgi:rhamnulokinase
MDKVSCVAIDLGASSGRVAVVECAAQQLSLHMLRRFDTARLRDPQTGYQCWDLDRIESEIRAGLAAADAAAPRSVGVDSWAVDYVLLDAAGHAVAPAVSYRDDRTQAVMETVFAAMPAAEVYRRTGIQIQPFNTLYQLAATARQQPGWLARTRQLLMLPDYFHFKLTGAIANEYTNATTTQLYGLATDDWDDELLALAGISRDVLTRPVAPGTILGETRTAGGRLQVVVPATHDTASAVAAIPLAGADEAFLISGTWSLMGIESTRPFSDATARRLNVTNEGGVERRYRVLKNIAGLWLTQRIAQESGTSDAELIAAAEATAPWRSLIDPEDPRFLSPPSMIAAIRGFCAETGQPEPVGVGPLARCAYDSLALSYRRVKRELESLLGHGLARIRVGGGGGQNRLLDQLAADACGVPLIIGPAESSLLGNACVQLIGLGVFGSLADARAQLRRSFPGETIEPRGSVPDAAWDQFSALGQRRATTEPADRGADRAQRSPQEATS